MPEPFANLGAEDDKSEPGDSSSPVARLAMHFEAAVRRPPWRSLADVDAVVPWLSNEAAATYARERGMRVWGAAADVVRALHDKAWAMHAAKEHALVDDELTAMITVLSPELLARAAEAAAVIEETIARWPAWARADATLKPRWGTSGRGRVRVRDGVVDAAVRGGFAGLAQKCGAILEPWLARVHDLSSQWLVDDWGEVRLLGCTRQIVRRSGVWLGCEIVRGDDGQGSGTAWDHDLVARARPLVEEAARAGYVGVCGVDAFTWQHPRDGVEKLRAVVELNARFTGGAVALYAVSSRWGRATFRIQD